MTKLKVGDVVTLKSGGPKMTVGLVKDDDASAVRCVWFDRNLTGLWNCSDQWFHVDCLKQLEQEPSALSSCPVAG